MENLGQYQGIVIEAKRAGGVEAWIAIIEDAARTDATTSAFRRGVGVGALVSCAVVGGAIGLRGIRAQKRQVAVAVVERHDESGAAETHRGDSAG